MTYSDKVRAEVAARYGVAVRCSVQIIPLGVISVDADPWATDWAVRRRRLLTAKERQKMAELRRGGATFQQIGRYLGRSSSQVYSVLG